MVEDTGCSYCNRRSFDGVRRYCKRHRKPGMVVTSQIYYTKERLDAEVKAAITEEINGMLNTLWELRVGIAQSAGEDKKMDDRVVIAVELLIDTLIEKYEKLLVEKNK